MRNISVKFLDWRLPPTETAAAKLRELGRGAFPTDFSHLRIVTPTAEAGRLLRERIALACAGSGGAVNFHVSMPEQLIDRPASATPTQTMLAWLETLRAADGRDFAELFRNDVLERFKSADEMLLGWGECIQQCRTALASEGLDLERAKETLDRLCRECAGENSEIRFCRFAELRELEKHYLRNLARIAGGLPDPAVAMLEGAEHPHLPPEVEKIVLIDCADLAGAPRRFLENSGVAVECWVNAPEEYREHFDAFGCPEPAFWNDVPIELDVEKRLRVVPRPDQQAKKIIELVNSAAAPPGAIAVLDPEVASALESCAELAARIPGGGKTPEIFVPREIPLPELPWSKLLVSIVETGRDDTIEAATAVWRSPLFSDYAVKVAGVGDPEKALQLLDELRQEYFVRDAKFLDALLADNPGAAAEDLKKLARLRGEWRDRLTDAADAMTEAFAILAEIGNANTLRHLDFELSDGEVQSLRQVAAELAGVRMPRTLLPTLLRRRLAAAKIRLREAPPDAVDAVGFLEIPWRSDRTVLIAGFNDSGFSAGNGDDLFLPDPARAQLGMMTRERRRAADALRFKALTVSRDLYILCGRNSQSGENLLPARLLFQCAAGELPRRIELVFRDELVEEPPVRDGAASTFLPRREAPKRMRITGFKNYFSCPFTFYLEQVLGFKKCDTEPPELDDAAFGTFAHDVLKECPRGGRTDADELASVMEKLLRRRMRAVFGDDPPGLVGLQCEMLSESMKYFAAVQSAEFAAGWRIVGTEIPLRLPWGTLYRAIFPEAEAEAWRDAVTLSGQIDRIDFRDETGEMRVLDYKTGAKAAAPAETHFAAKAPEWGEDARRTPPRGDDGKTAYWKDLQLPLYVLLARHTLQGNGVVPPAEKISAGYFNLPLEMTRTGLAPFPELDRPGFLESAAKCADATLRRIFVDGIFWPPVKRDLEIFPGCGIAAASFLAPGNDTERS
jgi:hypothetical protein